jgi:hypothetical protein
MSVIMEIKMRIERILDVVKLMSKDGSGKEWERFAFVGKTFGSYGRDVYVSCIGRELWERLGIEVGSSYEVSVNVSSREWSGKWYTDLSCWKAVRLSGSVKEEKAAGKEEKMVEGQVHEEDKGSDGLPF